MTIRSLILALALLLAVPAALAQAPASGNLDVPPGFDTSYRPSPSLSARLQREFLTDIRWSVGAATRDVLAAAFAERKPLDIWQDLVAADGLKTNNVVDALTSYWVLNWVTANGAYGAKIDNAPIRRQLLAAFANDEAFLTLNDQERQTMAEGYILNFLVQHAAVNEAVARKDVEALTSLATSAVRRFRQTMNVDLLALVPGPDGFGPRPASEATPADGDASASPEP